MTIQRVFRGHTGRRRAGRERDKYLFSKSQSQGIDFGRQMLLEHKLHATRLQSDVQLLTGEKVGAEEAVEAMMEEISEFEEAVSVLEREMHQLSKIETEAVGVLDEEARWVGGEENSQRTAARRSAAFCSCNEIMLSTLRKHSRSENGSGTLHTFSSPDAQHFEALHYLT